MPRKMPTEVRLKNVIYPTSAARLCLKCDKKFASEGAGNRICSRCKELNRTTLETYYHVFRMEQEAS